MNHSFFRKAGFGLLFSLALAGFFTYGILDALVLPKGYAPVKLTQQPITRPKAVNAAAPGESASAPQGGASGSGEPILASEGFYWDEHMTLSLTQYRENNTTLYAAEVTVSDPSVLQAGLAEDTFGRNITEPSSSMAQRLGAVLAVNGDYYGARDSGYVLRNGQLLRSDPNPDREDLVITASGDFTFIREAEVPAQDLADQGAWQVFSFGPVLVRDGAIDVAEDQEIVDSPPTSSRTALGQLGPGHYLFVVSDGRTEASVGLSLYQLADFMLRMGCVSAYNLDGGGSSTMVYRGEVANQPTYSGEIHERSVSDIVYLAA